jgi:hypothetical protein
VDVSVPHPVEEGWYFLAFAGHCKCGFCSVPCAYRVQRFGLWFFSQRT